MDTQSDPGAGGQGAGLPSPANPGTEAAGKPRWLCPELRFQFHDVTVQTCGLQAPAAAARPVRPPSLPPARQARAPQPPAHPGRRRRRRSPARPLARPREPPGSRGSPTLRGVDSRSRPRALRRTYSARPGRRRRRPQPCCARERANERAREGGRGGRAARGARGRRRAVSRRAVPQGPGAASAPSRGAALRPRGPPAACVLRAASVAPAAPRLASSRRGPLPLCLAPRRSRCRPCGRGTVPARRLCGSAPGSPASRRLLYLERAEPSFPPPSGPSRARPRSLSRPRRARPAHLPPPSFPPARSGAAVGRSPRLPGFFPPTSATGARPLT